MYKDKHYSTLGETKHGWPAHLWEATKEKKTIKTGGAKGKYPRGETRKFHKNSSDDSQMAGFLASNRSEATRCTTYTKSTQKGKQKERKEDQPCDGISVAGNGLEELMASNRAQSSKGEETIDTHEVGSIGGTTAKRLTRSVFGKRLKGKQVVHKTEIQVVKETHKWRCPACDVELKHGDNKENVRRLRQAHDSSPSTGMGRMEER